MTAEPRPSDTIRCVECLREIPRAEYAAGHDCEPPADDTP